MRREPAVVLGLALIGGLMLLVAEPAVGFVALAGTGAALLLQPRARRVVAAVLALVSLGTAVIGAVTGQWLLLTGSALVAAAAAAATVRSARWPARAATVDAPRSDPAQSRSDRDTWAALDRGEDPTA